MAKTPLSNTGDAGLIPEHGAKIPHALQPSPPPKHKIVTSSIKTLKMVHIKKKHFKKVELILIIHFI